MTQGRVSIANYFEKFTNLKLDTIVDAAIGNNESITFYDVYRKAPWMDLTIKEVTLRPSPYLRNIFRFGDLF